VHQSDAEAAEQAGDTVSDQDDLHNLLVNIHADLQRAHADSLTVLDAIADLATGETGPAVIKQADIDQIALAVVQLLLSNIRLTGSLSLEQGPNPPAWSVQRGRRVT
jgi:hypothetical protein